MRFATVVPALLTLLLTPRAVGMTEPSFVQLGLHADLSHAASRLDWPAPTPIQQQSIPAILDGKSVWAEAPTGSGKTAAFALPLLQRHLETGDRPGRRRRVKTLIVAPTRELAVQTADAFVALCRELPRPADGGAHFSNPRVVAVTGGVSIQPQLRSLGTGGADVLVGTPGRLLEVLESNGVSLESVSTLVLDEADRLLAPAFGDELEAILAHVARAGLQTLLYSATFPYASRPRARRMFGSRPFVSLRPAGASDGAEKEGEEGEAGEGDGASGRRRLSCAERYASAAPPATIAQRAILVDVRERTPLLRHLLETEAGWTRVLVFVASQKSAEHVAAKLRRSAVAAEAFHGGLSQEVRAQRLDDLRASRLRVLVATDVAARGLDVVGLEAIVNYELPRSTADFTHRVGRTGRAGEAGVAVSFVASTGAANEAHFALIEKRHGMQVAREAVEGFEPTDGDRFFVSPRGGAGGEGAERAGPPGEAEEGLLPGVRHSKLGLSHDRMHGGVKGRRMSKKDKLRAQHVAALRPASEAGGASSPSSVVCDR